MSVREHKSEKKKVPFAVQSGSTRTGQVKEQWLFPRKCWAWFVPAPREPLCLCFREDGLGWERGSDCPGSLRVSTEWTILSQANRWQFSSPTDLCWLLNTNKTKPLQQIHFTQRDSIQRESSFYLATWGNFHIIILELDLIFMTLPEGGNFDFCYRVACACLGKVFWEMLYFLEMKAVGKWCSLSLEALLQSPNTWISGKHLCLFAFRTKNMSLWLFRDHSD